MNNNKKHYAWVICFLCFLINYCALGLTCNGMVPYLPFIREQIGMSNTQVALISTLRCLFSTLTIPTAGWFYHKFGFRFGTVLAMVLLMASRLVMAFAASPMLFYIGAAMMGIAYSYGAMYPTVILSERWFKDSRSTATGIAFCGSSVCAIICPPITTWLVENFSLKAAFMVEAGEVVVIAAILFILMRDQPSDIGLKPYISNSPKAAKEAKERRDVILTPIQSKVLFAGILIQGLIAAGYSSSFSVHYADKGYSSAVIAISISVYGILLAIGKLAFGYGVDKIGTYKVTIIFAVIWIVSSFLTAGCTGPGLFMIMASAMGNGIGMTNGSIGVTSWSGDLTTKAEYDRSIKRYQTIFYAGCLGGSAFPGIVADLTGSYTPAYTIYGFVILISTLLILGLYRSHKLY